MIQANTLIAGAAAVALLLGVTGQGTIPKELRVPLSNKDIVIVKDEAQPSIGQSEATVKQSAEMGKATASRQESDREMCRRAGLKV
jgi:hypothetical protein